MLKVGLTGGIGSGKSVVAEVFKSLGIPVYSSDDEAKNILDEDEDVKFNLKSLFGDHVYINGKLDRKEVAGIVFNNADALTSLNKIVHPAVRHHFLSWLEKHKDAPYVIKEAAILIESGAHKDMDTIVTVFAPKEIRVKRVMARDNSTLEAIESRISKQMDEDEKLRQSNHVIYNDEQQLVLPQVIKLHELFLIGKVQL